MLVMSCRAEPGKHPWTCLLSTFLCVYIYYIEKQMSKKVQIKNWLKNKPSPIWTHIYKNATNRHYIKHLISTVYYYFNCIFFQDSWNSTVSGCFLSFVMS